MQNYVCCSSIFKDCETAANYIQENPDISYKEFKQIVTDKKLYLTPIQYCMLYCIFSHNQDTALLSVTYKCKIENMMEMYFIFAKDLDVPPTSILNIIKTANIQSFYPMWQTIHTTTNFIQQSYTRNRYLYPFEWYIIRKHQLPPEFYLDGVNIYKIDFSLLTMRILAQMHKDKLYQCTINLRKIFRCAGYIYDDDIDEEFVVPHDVCQECCICLCSDKKLFNFCKNKHNVGYCADCYNNLLNKQICPICKENM